MARSAGGGRSRGRPRPGGRPAGRRAPATDGAGRDRSGRDAVPGDPDGSRGDAAPGDRSHHPGSDVGPDDRNRPRAATEPPALPPAAGDRAAAEALFGDRLALAGRYAGLLATDGVVRGLIGPREAPRLWERHLLNCAAVAELIPAGAVVADVGSGAGLPGVVLAIARPDLSVVLIEPLARRTAFLQDAVDRLGLAPRVRVCRARAEEAVDRIPAADVVTARAVAPLDRLAGWCLPLVRVGGQFLALKGASAADEVATAARIVDYQGGGRPEVLRCGAGVLAEPTTVVRVVRERPVEPGRPAARSAGARARARNSRGRRGRG